MEDYLDPYQCVLEIRSGNNRDEIERVLSPLLVGIDPAFELVSLTPQKSFTTEYRDCGNVSNDSHLHELDEGEYIESPALAVCLFLDENSSSLTPEMAKQCLQSDSWEFHHKIELSKLQNGTPKTIARQEYYTLGTDLPLWSVGSIHYGNEHLRFNLFTRRFAAMVEFYRVLTGKEGECTRSGFCMFPIYSQPGLDIQLALKRSERIIPVAVRAAALRFKIRNVKELRSIATGKINQVGDSKFSMLDPDGNLVILEQTGNSDMKTASPRLRASIDEKTLEDNRSIADSYDSGRYSNSSDHGESDMSSLHVSSKDVFESPVRKQSNNTKNAMVNPSGIPQSTPPKPAPRQKLFSAGDSPHGVRPTPTKRKTVLQANDNAKCMVNDSACDSGFSDSRLFMRTSRGSPTTVTTGNQGEESEQSVSVRDRANAYSRQIVENRRQSSPQNFYTKRQTCDSPETVHQTRQSGTSMSLQSRREDTTSSPRTQDTYKNENHGNYPNLYTRSKSLSGIQMDLSLASHVGDVIIEDDADEQEQIYRRLVRGRTASSGAVLSGHHSSERGSPRDQRIPTETMNKLLKTLPARLEGQSGAKPYVRLDQRIRRVLNGSNNSSPTNSPSKEDPRTTVGARF